MQEYIHTILEVAIVVLFIRSIYTLFALLFSLNWLKKMGNIFFNTSDINVPKMFIVIPALREQKTIIETLKYFSDNFLNENVRIIVVTTQKEFNKPFEGKSTQDLVNEFINNTKNSKYIQLIDYPRQDGYMAHQLNYVISKIDDKNAFFTLYNADSRPHPNTLKAFYYQYLRHPNEKVFQQSAIFTKNFDMLGKAGFINGLFLQTCAILQTRWTLVHEIFRYLRLNLKYFSSFLNAHVVGHGLIISLDLLKSYGGFPIKTLTEDLFLGFIIRSQNIKIIPIPILEIADSPSTVKATWMQKYVWFWGPFKYFTYLKYVASNSELNSTSLINASIIAFQGLISAVAWVISGPLILFLLLIPFVTSSGFLIFLSYLLIILYGPLQFSIIYYNFPLLFKLGGQVYSKVSFVNLTKVFFMSIPVIIFNSLPTFHTIFAEISHKVLNTNLYKPKTGE